MKKIGLFYGSTTGFTEEVAGLIKEKLNEAISNLVEDFDIRSEQIKKIEDFEYLIIGSSTWNIGELQDDWDAIFTDLDDLDMTGRKLAIFGLGDQYGYPDNFCDAIGILGGKFQELGAELFGFTDLDDSYEFEDSLGLKDGRWQGLALDEDNQNDLTEDRVDKWLEKVLVEFKIKI